MTLMPVKAFIANGKQTKSEKVITCSKITLICWFNDKFVALMVAIGYFNVEVGVDRLQDYEEIKRSRFCKNSRS